MRTLGPHGPSSSAYFRRSHQKAHADKKDTGEDFTHLEGGKWQKEARKHLTIYRLIGEGKSILAFSQAAADVSTKKTTTPSHPIHS